MSVSDDRTPLTSVIIVAVFSLVVLLFLSYTVMAQPSLIKENNGYKITPDKIIYNGLYSAEVNLEIEKTEIGSLKDIELQFMKSMAGSDVFIKQAYVYTPFTTETPIYETVCTDVKDSKNSSVECTQKEAGTTQKTKWLWKEIEIDKTIGAYSKFSKDWERKNSINSITPHNTKTKIKLIIGFEKDTAGEFLVRVTDSDGESAYLDPWFNSTYVYRLNIDCTNITSKFPIVINGSNGFSINGEEQTVWTTCSGSQMAVYYNDAENFVVANDTDQMPMDVELGNGTSYLAEQVWTNEIAIYHLSNLSDSGLNDNNLSTTCAQVTTYGKIGNAYNLSSCGASEALKTGLNNLGSNFTAVGWFKGAPSDYAGMFSNYGGGGWIVYTDAAGDNISWFSSTGNNLGSDLDVNSNSWLMAGVTFDNSNVQFTYNGRLNQSVGSTVPDGTDDVWIGGYTDAADRHWPGLIDEVRFYNESLTSSELNQMYRNIESETGFGSADGIEENNYPYSQSGPLTSFEGVDVSFNLSINVSKSGTVPITNLSLVFDGDYYSSTTNQTKDDYKVFTKTITLSTIPSGLSKSYSWYWNYSINNSLTETSTSNIIIYSIFVDNCSTANTTTIIFDMYNETDFENLTNYKTELDIWFTDIVAPGSSKSKNYSVASASNGTHKFCIYPENKTLYAYASMEYTGDGFDARTYYLVNVTLNATPSRVNLYNIQDSIGEEITFTIQDASLSSLSDTYVQIQKKDTASATYKTVFVGLSDFNGIFTADLEKGSSVLYKFIVINNQGDILDTLTPVSFATTDTEYIITTGFTDIFNYFGDLAYSCSYVNTTKQFICDVVDSSGLMTSSRMLVEYKITHSYQEICDKTDTSSSVTYVCQIDDVVTYDPSYNYRYLLYANDVLIDSGQIKTESQTMSDYGAAGLFVVFLVVIVMAFMGSFNPAVGILLTVVGLIMSQLMGILSLSESALVGMVFVAGIIIIRMAMMRD